MVTVLITGMGSTTAISVVKGLRQQTDFPVKIVGTDSNQAHEIAGSTFCDAFYTVPLATSPAYIPTLLEICAKEQVAVLFPIVDPELEAVAAHISAFQAQGVTAWVSDLAVVQTCNDKARTFRFLRDNGFATPETWLPEAIAGQEATLSYPLIVKPANGVSSAGVQKVESPDALQKAISETRHAIIQTFATGTEYTVDVTLDADSNLLAVVPRERIETKAGISYKGRTVRHPGLIALAGNVAKTLPIRGACNIQCFVDGDSVQVLEINPRFSGALPLTIAAGVNSPALLTKLAMGQPLEKTWYDFRAGVYMARFWEERFFYENSGQ